MLACRAAIVADVLAGGPIRDDFQAHLPVACVAERLPASTPAPLPVWPTGRNAAALVDASTRLRTLYG
jgi:hypothetical protein